MRKIALIFTVALLLTSCADAPAPVASGKVVGCEQINREEGVVDGVVLECLDGQSEVALSALRGPMIINVWGSWCYPCKEEIPIFRSFYEKASKKLQLVGIDVEEKSPEDGAKFVVKQGITWPNLYDSTGISKSVYGMGVPVTWFVAPDGSVAFKKIGVIKDEKELIQLTRQHLGISI